MTKLYVKDWWLWSKVSICLETCDKCGDGCSIRLEKRYINKLIKILRKLNYKGIPKRNKYTNKEYIVWKVKAEGGK